MRLQRRLAAQVIGCSPKKIVFDETKLDDIKEAITKADIRNLIGTGAIIVMQKSGVSRARANRRRTQKIKGRLRGHGRRKGTFGTRGGKKRSWINRVRIQRDFVLELRKAKKIDNVLFKELYRKIKGGFFRSRGHIIVYLEERNILKPRQVAK